MTNRITDTEVENLPTAPERPPVVRAYQAWAFRCVDCGHAQFAQRSSTAEQKCGRCGKCFTVEIKS